VVEDEGQARDYIGAYEYYYWKCAKELEDQIPPEAKLDKKKEKAQKEQPTTEHVTDGTATATVVPPTAQSRRDLSKSFARLEKQVATAEQEIATLEEQIKARDIERLPQKPTKIIHAGMPFIKNERNGLATWTASPTNGATSPPNSKNNNPKSRNSPHFCFF